MRKAVPTEELATLREKVTEHCWRFGFQRDLLALIDEVESSRECAYCNPCHGQAPSRWPWRYPRGSWSGRRPSLGGDEWCRRTLVLPTWLFGTWVIPLWTCRGCEVCEEDCQ